MGNSELTGKELKELKERFYLNVIFIGNVSFGIKQLFKINNLNFNGKKVEEKKEEELKLIQDYWDLEYSNTKTFEGKCDEAFSKIIAIKKQNQLIDQGTEKFRICLVVRIENTKDEKIEKIFQRFKDINSKQYQPIILFLCDSFDDEKDQTIIPDKKKYEKIDERLIYTEKLNFNDQDKDEENFLMKRLLKICSIFNELGDKFTIGKNKNIVNYDLVEQNFPFTLNMVTLGKTRQGKSAICNCVLNEYKALETDSGTSQTQEINYYHANKIPIKILDVPGFDNDEIIEKVVKKLKELNQKINRLRDRIHIFLYVLSIETATLFNQKEYLIFNEILNHEEAFVLFVITHSDDKIRTSENKRSEYIQKINESLGRIMNNGFNDPKFMKNKTEEDKRIYINKFSSKMKAKKDNVIFVNLYKTEDTPAFGVKNLFLKFFRFFWETKSFQEKLSVMTKL